MLEKNVYQILLNKIPETVLVSETSQNWYDSSNQLFPWSGSLYYGPNINDVYYNTGGTLSSGYYKWDGVKWTNISKENSYLSYNIPLYLESYADELGVMVGFDGDIEQIEQLVNFSYTQSENTVNIYNTVNPDKLRVIVEQVFTIKWGDGQTSQIEVNSGILNTNLPVVSHTYTQNASYTITLTLNSPWSNQKVSKIIQVPANTEVQNVFGTFTGITVPAYSNLTGQTQNYLNDLEYTNNTGYTTSGFTYLAIGKSQISTLKLYGTNTYSGVTYGTDSIGNYSAYTINGLYYKDYPDGYTMITGTTVGFTKEEVFNKLITRNEHFLGFVDEPIIYSDIFVQRGKQNVMENNLRLCEVDNIGELSVYQNEFFVIKKQ
jgi:hypothetical protein